MKSALSALFFGLLFASVAHANAANPFYRNPQRERGTFLYGQTPLEVLSETIVFRSGVGAAPWTFEATYSVRNPTAETVETIGAFYGEDGDDYTPEGVIVTSGGVDLRFALTPEIGEAIDARVRSLDATLAPEALGARTGYRLSVAAGATVDLVFRGSMASAHGRYSRRDGYLLSAAAARHLFFSEEPNTDGSQSYRYLLSAIRDWARVPTIEVRVEFPSDRDVVISSPVLSEESEGDRTVLTTRIDPRAVSFFEITEIERADEVVVGGPFVALGGQLDEKSFRFRAGWEFAVPRFVIYGLAIETNFDDRLAVIPTVELATPQILFIPSIGLAAGVPVRVRDNESAQPGVRLQFTLTFLAASLVIPLDVYPGADKDVVEISMMGQLSL